MPHILVAGRIQAEGLKLLQATPGFVVENIESLSTEAYSQRIHEADALLVRTQAVTEEIIARAPRLKIVSRHGVGYDAVDEDALTARNIALANCPGVNAVAVAEHALMLLLAASKRALYGDFAVRSGLWKWRDAGVPQRRELYGKSLLLIGFGNIGREVATRAQAFGIVCRAYNPSLFERGWPDDTVQPELDLHEALGRADIVSLSIPGGQAPVLGAAEFESLKPGAIIINTGRGDSVDEAAMIVALQSGRVAAAGLDVFQEEPLATDNPLASFKQVFLSPHCAGLAAETAERMSFRSAQNIVSFFSGTIDPSCVVNRHRISMVEARSRGDVTE